MTSDPRYPHGDPRWHTDNWLNELWLAQPEDTIGCWCVTVAAIPGTPASGNPPIADFCTEEVARHVAHVHNLQVLAQGGPQRLVADSNIPETPPTTT